MSATTSMSRVVSGSRSSRGKVLLALAAASVVGSLGTSARAAIVDWVGTAGDGLWATGNNWFNETTLGNTAPVNDIAPDIAKFDLAAYSTAVNIGGVSINGLIFGDPAGNLINPTLTGGSAGPGASGALTISGLRPNLGSGGIVMYANSGPVTISSGIRLFSSQSWINYSSSELDIGGGIARTRDLGSIVGTLNIANMGTGSVVTGLANDATGEIGPWISFTNPTGTYYATNTGGGTVGAYTGGTAVATADGASVNNAAINYDLTLSGTSIVTTNATANTIRNASTTAQTIQINGAATLTANGILNAGGGKLTISAGPGATGGLDMGSNSETVILPTTANIEIGAAIINPVTNTGARYYLTIGGGPYTVGLNQVVNDNSAAGNVLVISGTMGTSQALSTNTSNNFLTIGASRNLTLNAAAGDLYLSPGPISTDNDTGGNADLGIQDNPAGPSTVTIMSGPGLVVGLSGNSTFSGGLILNPGASVYIHAWSPAGQLGTGPVSVMGNNTFSKYLNSFTSSTNNQWNIYGNIEFTGEPAVHNPTSYGTSNNSMTFITTGNAAIPGDGEVVLMANNIVFDTDTPSTVSTPAYANATISFGGFFDGGHSYNIIKTGPGTLRSISSYLATGPGASTQSANWTGSLTVQQGTFTARDAAVFNRDNLMIVNAGATLTEGGNPNSVAGFDDGASGGGTVSASTVSWTLQGGGTYAFSGVITNTIANTTSTGISKDSIGTQTLSGANTYAGLTSIAGGTLNLNFGGAGAPPTSNILYHGVAVGPGNVTLAGGTLILTGASGAANSQDVGQIAVSRGSALTLNSNSAASLVLNTGNLTRSNGGAVNFSLPTGTQSATNGVRTTAPNVNGIIGGFATVGGTDWATNVGDTHVAPGVNAETDPGTWDNLLTSLTIYTNLPVPPINTPVSFNTVTGTAPGISAGNIYYVGGLSGSLGALNYFTVSATPGGALITPTGTSGTLSIDTQGNIEALPAASYTAFNGSTDAATTNLLISSSASLTAVETINSLKIAPSAAGQSLDLGASQLTLDSVITGNNGATAHVGGLLFTGSNNYEIKASSTGTIQAGTGGDLVINQYGTGALTISANITDNGGSLLTKVGPGQLNLTGSNTFAGGVNLNGGVVQISSLQALGNGNAISFSGSTLRYATGFTGSGDITTTANGSAGRSVTINGDGLVVDTNGNNITFSCAYGFANGLTGNGGLTKVGAGTLTLNSNGTLAGNAYLGATTISGGVLSLGANMVMTNGRSSDEVRSGGTNLFLSALGKSTNAPTNLVLDGGELQYMGIGASTDRNFTLTQNGGGLDESDANNGALVFTNTSAIALTGSGARTLTLSGTSTGLSTIDLSLGDGTGGATSLIKNGTGTWVMNNPSNTYSGGTTVNAGILIDPGSALGTGNVMLNGGTLGGAGTIAGTILGGSGAHTIAPSATLSPTSATTLTAGGLTTNANTTISLNLVTPGTGHTGAGSVNDAINVTGNNGLTLNGGKLAIANTSTGAASLGYYRIMQYSGSIQGTGISSLTLPAVQNKVAYTLSTTQDPGYLDVHRGLLGDANDDGLVNFADFVVLSNNFGLSNKGWSGGDFNGDGITNFADFVILSNNFGATIGSNEVASAGAGATSGVPEPTSLALLGAGLLGVIGARRRARAR